MDQQEWKDRAQKALGTAAALARQLKDEGLPYATYTALATLSLAPITEAIGQSNLAGAVLALVGVAGDVGANLIANLVQNWKDKPQHEQAKLLLAELAKLPDLHIHLDKIIQHIDAIAEAHATLQLEDRQWFAETLQAELKKIGSPLKIYAKVKVDKRRGTFIQRPNKVVIKQAAPDQAGRVAELTRRSYLLSLCQDCNQLYLSVLAGDRDPHDQSGEAALHLNDVYIELNTTDGAPLPTAEQRQQVERFLEESKKRPLTALEVAIKHSRLVLLGDPGSGKSSFTNHLLFLCAGHLLDKKNPLPNGWPTHKALPVKITLRELAIDLQNAGAKAWLQLSAKERDRKLLDAMETHLEKRLNREAAAFHLPLLAALTAGECLIVLDGLDEVPFAERGLMRAAISALAGLKGANLFIVTCRKNSWDPQEALPAFHVTTLEPFTDTQIESFVEHWYGGLHAVGVLPQQLANERLRQMKDDIAPLPGDLKSNPLLLTTMAVVHFHDTRLPDERVVLYKRAAEVMLKRWELLKAGADSLPETTLGISDRELYPALRELAYVAHATGKKEAADIPREKATAVLVKHFARYEYPDALAGKFLDYIDQRAGLLVGKGGLKLKASYSFPHRTFQEFFAGNHLLYGAEKLFIDELKNKRAEGDYWQVAAELAVEHLLHNDYNERAAMDAAYELCPRRDIEAKDDVQWRGVLWSALFAKQIGVEKIRGDSRQLGGPGYLERIGAHLRDLIEQGCLSVTERAEAGRVMNVFGDPRPGVCDFHDSMWVQLNGGAFTMGEGNEAHPVKLSPFKISRYPITNAQFEKFILDGGYKNDAWWSKEGIDYRNEEKWQAPHYWNDKKWNLANHPVVGVLWFEAEAFCNWLSRQMARNKKAIVRLPTEAEWEFAARGGKGDGKFPWGDDDPTSGRANYHETRLERTSAVGCFPDGKTSNGIFDLAGNVWEWCLDWYGNKYYAECKKRGTIENPTGPANGDRRVLRGGSWNNIVNSLRAATGYRYHPGGHWHDDGFRVVVSSEL